MIRNAGPGDIPALAKMGRVFLAKAYPGVAFDEATFRETLSRLVENDSGILLMSRNGMIGGIVYPLYFNRNELAAQEMFWWAARGEGMALLSGFEMRAREMGAGIIMMSSVGELRGDTLSAFYARRGYRQAETQYFKRVQA